MNGKTGVTLKGLYQLICSGGKATTIQQIFGWF